MRWTVRLAAALSVSGFVLSATCAGNFALSFAALLWAAPALVAARSLPLAAALPVALVPLAAGRFVAFHQALGDRALAASALCAAALVPALVVDRFATTWAPRAGLLAWPCALVVTARAVAGTEAGPLVAPLPHLDAVLYPAGDLGTAAGILVVAVLCNGFALLAGALNRQVPDPYGQDEREAGARVGSIVALALAALLFVVAAVRGHVGAAPSEPAGFGEAVVAVCAAGLLAAVVAAVWRRTKAAPAPRTA